MGFLKSIENLYNSSKESIKNKNGNIFISHFGELDSDKISEICESTENYLFDIGAAKKNIKIIFNVLIEGLQNIKNHGAFSKEGIQHYFFNISVFKEYFICSFSNLIDKNHIASLSNNIDHLNTLDKVGLKSIYLETLTNGKISKKGGAGLGVIIMAMKSKNKIDYQYNPLDNEVALVTLNIKVNKL